MDAKFEKALTAERLTGSGRYCAEQAKAYAEQADACEDRGGVASQTACSKEARGWLALGLKCDEAKMEAEVARLNELLSDRADTAGRASALQ